MLTEDEVRHVARLCRLHLSDEEVGQYTEQLSAVLDYVKKLNELDLKDVEPMAHALDMTNVMRTDEPDKTMPVDEALKNAPERWESYFKVPKVLEGDAGA